MKYRLLMAAIAVVFVGAACNALGDTGRAVGAKPGQFRLDEWAVTADQSVLGPGRHTITATNLGRHTHELIIVRAADAASLPTKSDGSVDEEQLANVKVGEIANVPAGTSRQKVFDFKPGSYVAFCNIVGGMGMGNGMMGGMQAVHFDAGMHAEFTVSG